MKPIGSILDSNSFPQRTNYTILGLSPLGYPLFISRAHSKTMDWLQLAGHPTAAICMSHTLSGVGLFSLHSENIVAVLDAPHVRQIRCVSQHNSSPQRANYTNAPPVDAYRKMPPILSWAGWRMPHAAEFLYYGNLPPPAASPCCCGMLKL